jgi:hypothetical protein
MMDASKPANPNRGDVKWVEVSNFRGTNPKSFEDQERSLEGISKLIEDFGFSIGTSRIRSYQNVLSKLKAKAEQNSNFELSDGIHLLHTSVELSQLGTILRAARAAPNLSIWRSHLEKLISGTHPETPSKLSASWDFQFEALVAGVAQLSGYEIEFDEPDIVVKDGNITFGIAAKRPRTAAGIRRNLRKAAKQISKSNRDGMIALDCSVILATDRAITTISESHAVDFVSDLLARFMQDNASEINRVRSERNLLAVLLALHMPVTIVDSEWKRAVQLTTAFRWTVVPLTEPSDPRFDLAIRFAQQCQTGLFSGSRSS